VRIADHEKEKADDGELTFKNWVVDYEFNESEELFLRFWFVDDFDEIQKAHPMKFDQVDQPFAPITLKGDEDALLDFYTDPKVRSLLTSMGKYRRLVPHKTPKREQGGADQPATRSESKSEGTDKTQPDAEGRPR
jgi:hypothetical protein